MEHGMNKLNKFYRNEKTIERALKKVNDEYRPFDPGLYLYRKIMGVSFEKKFSSEFIELAYVTLIAWNMNSRGAKLQEYKKFKRSIISNQKIFRCLHRYKLNKISDVNVEKKMKKLFNNLDLVLNGKPPLVTFAKTLHFFLPNLVCPIDRKYTLQYFYGNTNVPVNKDKQFDKFKEIQKAYGSLSSKVSLSKYKNKKWNTTIPKIADNITIGYLKGKK